MGDTRRIVAGLARATQEQGITRADLAQALGVNVQTVNDWLRGRYAPPWPVTLAWAGHVRLRLAVVSGARILAEGAEIPGQFRSLRQKAGLTTAEVAERGRIVRKAVTYRERCTRTPHLGTVAHHVAALDCRLALLREAS